MKKIINTITFLIIASCTVPEHMEGPISNNGPLLTDDNNSTVSSNNLVGQTWRITSYRVGEIGQMIPTSDLLEFISRTNYKFNGYSSSYSLTITGSGYNLLLNETPWGNLSGSILSNNITSGTIPGIPFTNVAIGSSNNTRYFLWIVKI
jgi:hypothetical protein